MTFANDPRIKIKPVRKPRFKKRPRVRVAVKPNLPEGYRWFKCPVSSWALPTKPEPVMANLRVGGFKFDDAPARWELQPVDLQMVSGIQLLRRFRIEAKWWRKPMSWIRNPERNGEPLYGMSDTILAVYGKRYHIAIERNDMFGPHACRLFYRSWQVPDEVAWVAICQIKGMWHSDERILKALNFAIRNRELWQSNDTASTLLLK